MSYLRLIQYRIQDIAETLSSALNVDVAIADKNLTRIAGTGNFHDRIDENCPEDSLFATVLSSGEPKVNLSRGEDCINCSNSKFCSEHANISYPIKIDDEVIGVISFASFDVDQADVMRLKKEEYFNMLRQTAYTIEKEIISIKIINLF